MTKKQVAKTNNKIPPELAKRNITLEQWRVLSEQIWPNTTKEAKLMAIDYCIAKRLDPILRPFNIIGIPTKKDGAWTTRESVWWAIAGLRIIAHRTGEYVGQSEPAFGEVINEKLGDVDMSYPLWCKITVSRKVKGEIAEFTGMRFWKETYQRIKSTSDTPNRMWQRRTFEQLAKCTEADALRKAFPEEASGAYVHEEMQGDRFDPAGAIEGEIEERPTKEETATEAPERPAEAQVAEPAPKEAERAPQSKGGSRGPKDTLPRAEPEPAEVPMIDVKDHIGAIAARYDGTNLTECSQAMYDLLADCGEEGHISALKENNKAFLEAWANSAQDGWNEFLQASQKRGVEIQGEVSQQL